MNKKDIYFRNIARRWRREVAISEGFVSIFSPYVTSSTADLVAGGVASGRCSLYTRFEAEAFASGSSSIRTLRRLCEAGCTIYGIASLHAKVVVAPPNFASIGSQNLTASGTHNREATVVFTNKADVALVEKLAEELSESGVPVTLKMIQELEDRIAPLVRQYRIAKKDAVALDFKIGGRRARAADFARKLNKLERRSLIKSGRVSPPSYPARRVTLLSLQSLVVWKIDGATHSLASNMRYLCVDRKSCWIGWARVCKTRITFIENEVTVTSPVFAHLKWRMSFAALWRDADSEDANLEIALSVPGSRRKLRVRMFFAVDSLTIVGITEPPSAKLLQLRRWIRANPKVFKSAVLKEITEPFRYSKRQCTGAEADEFFGPVGTHVDLSLAIVKQNPIIVVERG